MGDAEEKRSDNDPSDRDQSQARADTRGWPHTERLGAQDIYLR